MREISTKKIEIGEHVMIDGAEYVADKADQADQDDVCKGCVFFNAMTRCSDFIGCDGIIFKKVKKESDYRPYGDTDELIEDWRTRFNKIIATNYMPLIWVRSRMTSQQILITAFNVYSVVFNGTRVDFRDLFDNYTYLDGSPCGKEEI